MSKQSKAEKAAQDALKARAVALSGLPAEQFDALSEEERNAFLTRAAAEIEAEEAAAAADQAERDFAEKQATEKDAKAKAAAKDGRAKQASAADGDRAETNKASNKQSGQDAGLVDMALNGEEIQVHPSCVDDHQRVGWKLS